MARKKKARELKDENLDQVSGGLGIPRGIIPTGHQLLAYVEKDYEEIGLESASGDSGSDAAEGDE